MILVQEKTMLLWIYIYTGQPSIDSNYERKSDQVFFKSMSTIVIFSTETALHSTLHTESEMTKNDG
jgi:hypothetical protein